MNGKIPREKKKTQKRLIHIFNHDELCVSEWIYHWISSD